MRTFHMNFGVALTLCAAALTASRSAYAQTYTLTIVGTDVPSQTLVQPAGVNASGHVVGTIDLANNDPTTVGFTTEPFLWAPTAPNGTSGVTQVLTVGTGGRGLAANASGVVVGAATFNGTTSAFVESSGAVDDFGLVAGDIQSSAIAINASGLVLGNSLGQPNYHGAQASHAFVATDGGALQLLPSFGGGMTIASDLNDAGEIVGSSATSSNLRNPAFEPFLLAGGQMVNMSGPGGFPASSVGTRYLINASGQVTGSFVVPGTITTVHAFLWTPSTPQGTSGTLVDLGSITGFPNCVAAALNDHGDVAGNCRSLGRGASSLYHAFLVHQGSIIDLNSVLPAGSPLTLRMATGINDAGQIVGLASESTSSGTTVSVGFLLTPSS